MKAIKILLLLVICVASGHGLSAQKCYRPEPMSTEQISVVKGIWKGNYNYEGKNYPVTVKLYTGNNITCQLDTPPVPGKETGEQIRFCGGGEFHFKKYIDDLSYEFQGTPINGQIEGLLTVRKDDKKIGSNGRFTLNRISGN